VDLHAGLCGGEHEGVGLLARRATGAPSGDRRAELGKHQVPQCLEDRLVAPEAGDRDAAEPGEGVPLLRIALEVETVGVGVGVAEPELGDPPRHPPANLSAYLAEALPAQSESGQSPLQEVNALGVGHAP
jgi:hypothetical protein